MDKNYEKATFAGGCFWCMIPPFAKLEGVNQAVAGYTGGKTRNPRYEEVSAGKTGHYEAVEITFDSSKIAYKELLDVFWRQIDPSDEKGQFADKGSQYKTAIFFHNEKQRKTAEKSKIEIAELLGKKIATRILPASKFYPAEEHHQDYYKKNPMKYNAYKMLSGRAGYLKRAWKNEKKA